MKTVNTNLEHISDDVQYYIDRAVERHGMQAIANYLSDTRKTNGTQNRLIFDNLNECDIYDPWSLQSVFLEAMMRLGESEVNDDEVLDFFNDAYCIVLHALNEDNPLLFYGDYLLTANRNGARSKKKSELVMYLVFHVIYNACYALRNLIRKTTSKEIARIIIEINRSRRNLLKGIENTPVESSDNTILPRTEIVESAPEGLDDILCQMFEMESNACAEQEENPETGDGDVGEEPDITSCEKNRQMKEAILRLLECESKDGRKIFHQQNHWYAVYKVMCDECGYDMNMKAWCSFIQKLGFGKDNKEISYECNYESVKKVPQNPGFASKSLNSWEQAYHTFTTAQQKMIKVALEFRKIINNSLDSTHQNENKP